MTTIPGPTHSRCINCWRIKPAYRLTGMTCNDCLAQDAEAAAGVTELKMSNSS